MNGRRRCGLRSSTRMSTCTSGKEKAHKHKQIFPVTARAGGGLLTGWGGVSRPVARGQKFMCCVRNPRNINVFVRVPGREESGSRPGGSVTGVTEKLFMCQMFMCLFRPLPPPPEDLTRTGAFELLAFRNRVRKKGSFGRGVFSEKSIFLGF